MTGPAGWPLAARLALWFVTGSIFAASCWLTYVRHSRHRGGR